MTGSSIQIEQLEGGLRAAFINMPHFRTSAARLTINSGSLHEAQEIAGAAHFLEHITFQGTEGMPTEEAMHRYTEDNGLVRNALTNQTFTSYIADGYELGTVGYFVTETALRPRLEPQALERERKPIIAEIRGYASSPFYLPNIAHMRATRGDRYARPIGGSVEDVATMSHENLTAYHARNYRLGNAILVLCSSEPVEQQREYAQTIAASIQEVGPDAPTPLDLPVFNPDGLISSLQTVDLPLTAQTYVGLNYALPETQNAEEQLSYNIICIALTKLVNRRLRSDLAICYGAQANVPRLANLNFGADQNWSHLGISVNLDGSDSIQALDEIKGLMGQELPADGLEAVFRVIRRNSDHMMESTPSGIADTVRDILAYAKREEIDLEEIKDLADRLTVDGLRKLHKDVTDTPPLVLSTSPDPKVLEQVGEWATTHV
jgi:predicted Zn-dependent peptidase